MPVITDKLKNLLKEKNLSQRGIAKLIGYSFGALGHMINKKCSFSEEVIERIAPILEVSPETIKGWILADKYSKNLLQKALQTKHQNPDAQPTIFRAKIDKLRQAENLNMIEFAAAIGYNQGWLSQASLGKKSTPPKLIHKLSNYSNIPEDEIKSWVIADKYSLEALQTAVE